MAKDWSKEKSATDMIRANAVSKDMENYEVNLQNEITYTEQLLEIVKDAIVYLQEQQINNSPMSRREPLIDSLFDAERSLTHSLTEYRVCLKRYKA
jgi:hypothetical protein